MKLKEIVYLLGWKPKPVRYPHRIESYDLPQDGRVEVAQWLHPRNRIAALRAEVIAELRRFLRPGDVAIDIGAYTGDTTLPMALAVGTGGAVFALEPNPYVFPVLEANAQLNPTKTRIVACPFAASAQDGELVFEYSDAGYCNGGGHFGIGRWSHGHAFKLTVQGRDLQRYLGAHHSDLVARLRYLKVDAEGSDDRVLASLRPLIEERRPYLRAEIFKHLPEERRRAFYGFFRELGYTVFRVESDARLEGERIDDAERMARWRHFDVFGVP